MIELCRIRQDTATDPVPDTIKDIYELIFALPSLTASSREGYEIPGEGYVIRKFNKSILKTSINMGLMLTKIQPHIDRGCGMFCLHLRNSSPLPDDSVL